MIPHNRPTLGEREQEAARRVLESGWLAQGREVAAFEDEVCAFLGLAPGHAVAVSSGSAALYLALLAVGGKGGEVAAPGYSCRSIWNAIELAGCRARWLDTRPAQPLADTGAAAGASAVIAAHMFGLPMRLPQHPSVIEDCAQALGSAMAGRKVGTFGRAAVFSFGATKPITSAGHGGMVVARDGEVVESVRRARDYDTVMDGAARFNFQMSDLEAAVGRVQLQAWPAFAEHRRQVFETYRDAGLPLLDADDAQALPFRFRAVLRTPRAERIRLALEADGIRAIVPVGADELLAPAADLPCAAALCATTLSLPIYPTLALEDAARIAAICSQCLD